MSKKILVENLSDKELEKISKELILTQEPSRYSYGTRGKQIFLLCHENNVIYVPFSYGKFPRPSRDFYTPKKSEDFFTGTLREEQISVKNEALNLLNKKGSILISAYCGFGKTLLSIYLASKIKLRCLIICHRIILVNQWKKAIETLCPKATVQILGSKKTCENSDFFIINATNISKRPKTFYEKIGLCIVDEAHIIMAEKMSLCMQYLTPRYLIGLSATPYRTDGLNALLDLYFGTEKITRELWKKHTVYKVDSGIKFETKLTKMGKVDWNFILESQGNHAQRNELIISLIKSFPDRVFLVLCKRISQAKHLSNRLREEGESISILYGKTQTYSQENRILIGTASKVGVGFDHPRLDTLLLASDIEQYFVQYLGRVFRTQNAEPIIFDIVDRFPLLQKHYNTRKKVYLQHGGEIRDYGVEENEKKAERNL